MNVHEKENPILRHTEKASITDPASLENHELLRWANRFPLDFAVLSVLCWLAATSDEFRISGLFRYRKKQ